MMVRHSSGSRSAISGGRGGTSARTMRARTSDVVPCRRGGVRSASRTARPQARTGRRPGRPLRRRSAPAPCSRASPRYRPRRSAALRRQPRHSEVGDLDLSSAVRRRLAGLTPRWAMPVRARPPARKRPGRRRRRPWPPGGAPPQAVLERLAADQLEDEEEAGHVLPGVVDPHGVGVLEPRGRAGFALEAVNGGRVVRSGSRDLHRDHPVEQRVAGAVDGAEPSRTQRLDDFVPVGDAATDRQMVAADGFGRSVGAGAPALYGLRQVGGAVRVVHRP